MVSYFIYYAFNHPMIDEMRLNSFHGSPVLAYIINSIALVLAVLLLCKSIRWLPIVSYFGRYSIIVLCVHMPALCAMPFVKKHLGHKLSVFEISIIVLIFCWIAIPICKRLLPYFVAQKALFKLPSEIRSTII